MFVCCCFSKTVSQTTPSLISPECKMDILCVPFCFMSTHSHELDMKIPEPTALVGGAIKSNTVAHLLGCLSTTVLVISHQPPSCSPLPHPDCSQSVLTSSLTCHIKTRHILVFCRMQYACTCSQYLLLQTSLLLLHRINRPLKRKTDQFNPCSPGFQANPFLLAVYPVHSFLCIDLVSFQKDVSFSLSVCLSHLSISHLSILASVTCVYGGQSTVCSSQVLGIELRSSGLVASTLYLLSHLAGSYTD